jgi:thiol-disulfide isomerase/thioredoxin
MSRIPILLVLVIAAGAEAQVASVEPAEARWGDTLTLTYDPAVEGSALTIDDEVYLVAFVHRGDASEQAWRPARLVDGRFTTRFEVEPGVSSLSFFFVSLAGYDRNVRVEVPVTRPDGSAPLGAHLQRMFAAGNDEYLDVFELEMQHHPEHYGAYRTKWFVVGAYEPDRLTEMVREDLDALAGSVETRPAGYLWALVYGHMLLDEEPKARAALLELLEAAPASFEAYRAFRDYDYHVFSKSLEGEGPEIVAAAGRKAVAREPASPLAREQALSLAHDDDAPLETLERVCSLWIDETPDHPLPHFVLGSALLEADPTRSIESLRAAIDLMLRGRLTLYESVSGHRTRSYLPAAYRRWAEAAFELDRHAEALGAVKASIALETDADARSTMLEARIWEELGDRARAESAYAEAWSAGSEEARQRLLDAYTRRHGSDDGFDTFLAKLSGATDRDEPQPAPAFTVTALDGVEYTLDQLAGKVVVLNFWFIGCAPCRVEIPGLNQLVADYADRDVVFIAFALDEADALKSFLTKEPFDYAIAPTAGDVATTYSVSSFPTHVLIDRKGRLDTRLTGGSKDRHDDLRPHIDRLLGP